MRAVSRRAFIQRTAGGALAAAATALAARTVVGASPYGWPIGWQTFPYRAAKTAAGVQNYFIEMNEQLMRESVAYLKALTV
jgi:hypothetical protein